MIGTIEAEHLTASVAEAFHSISLCGKMLGCECGIDQDRGRAGFLARVSQQARARGAVMTAMKPSNGVAPWERADQSPPLARKSRCWARSDSAASTIPALSCQMAARPVGAQAREVFGDVVGLHLGVVDAALSQRRGTPPASSGPRSRPAPPGSHPVRLPFVTSFGLPIVMAALQCWCTAQAQYMFRHV